MTLRTQKIFFVTCNWCPAEHHKSSTGSALEARIAAGVDGWAFRHASGHNSDETRRHPVDACPEHAHHITEEDTP